MKYIKDIMLHHHKLQINPGLSFDVRQRSPYRRTIFRIWRDMETHMVDAFHFREYFPALRQLGEIAYQHKVLYRTVQSREYSRTAYGLKYGIDDATGYILLRSIAVCLSKE